MRYFTIFSVFVSFFSAVSAQDADRSYTDDETFRNEVLNVTNTYREWFNATDLSWNETLVEAADKAITECIFEHSGQQYGENLAAGYQNVTAAVTAWMEEVTMYDYGNADFSKETGHFTQLVWKSTTELGCARKECGGDGEAPGWFIACEYYPPGNVLTLFEQEVNEQVEGPEIGSAADRLEAWSSWLAVWILVQVLAALA